MSDVPVDALVVFIARGMELSHDGSHVPAVTVNPLRDWLRDAKPRPKLQAGQRRALELALDKLAERKLAERAKSGKA